MLQSNRHKFQRTWLVTACFVTGRKAVSLFWIIKLFKTDHFSNCETWNNCTRFSLTCDTVRSLNDCWMILYTMLIYSHNYVSFSLQDNYTNDGLSTQTVTDKRLATLNKNFKMYAAVLIDWLIADKFHFLPVELLGGSCCLKIWVSFSSEEISSTFTSHWSYIWGTAFPHFLVNTISLGDWTIEINCPCLLKQHMKTFSDLTPPPQNIIYLSHKNCHKLLWIYNLFYDVKPVRLRFG